MLYTMLLSLHNLGRWFVVAAAVWALVRVWHGFATARPWARGDRLAGFTFLRLLELQVVLGLIVYVVSPLIRQAFGNMGQTMGNQVLRFFTVEHPLQMLLAIGAAHVGFVLAKRAEGDRAKFRRAAIGFTIAVLLILIAVPWTWGDTARPLLRLPW